VFGRSQGFSSTFSLQRADGSNALNGNNGFVVTGIGLGSLREQIVSGAGDVNEDGINDLLVAESNRSFE
jgi:hypothetical protein